MIALKVLPLLRCTGHRPLFGGRRVSHQLAQGLRTHIERPTINVDKLGCCTGLGNRFDGGRECVCHSDDNILVSNAGGYQSKTKSIGSTADTYAVSRTCKLGEILLKLLRIRTAYEHPRAQYPFKTLGQIPCNSTCGATKSTNGIPFPEVILRVSFQLENSSLIDKVANSCSLSELDAKLLYGSCPFGQLWKPAQVVVSHLAKVASRDTFKRCFRVWIA